MARTSCPLRSLLLLLTYVGVVRSWGTGVLHKNVRNALLGAKGVALNAVKGGGVQSTASNGQSSGSKDVSMLIRKQLTLEIEEMADSLCQLATDRRPYQGKVAAYIADYVHGALFPDIHVFPLVNANILAMQHGEMALEKLKLVVARIWPTAKVEVFGSYSTGLSLPSSDVDVVISEIPPDSQWKKGKSKHMQILEQELSFDKSWVSSVQSIRSASIPIIKLTALPCGRDEGGSGRSIKIDISFDSPRGSHRGPESAAFVNNLCSSYPSIRPLIVVLKQLLQERGLNDVYKGGLSSYALTLMVSSLLKRFEEKPPDQLPDTGTLFLIFLHVFGSRFDPKKFGVTLKRTEPLFPLGRAAALGVGPSFWQPTDPLILQDPLCTSNNVGRPCAAFPAVQVVLDNALQSIMEDGMIMVRDNSVGTFECSSILGKAVFGHQHHHQVLSFISWDWNPVESVSSHSPSNAAVVGKFAKKRR